MSEELIDNTVIDEQEIINVSDQKTLPYSIVALILGIISIGMSFVYGAGIVIGAIALSKVKKAKYAYDQNPELYSEGSVKCMNAGKTCSIVGLILSIVITAIMIFGVVALSVFNL